MGMRAVWAWNGGCVVTVVGDLTSCEQDAVIMEKDDTIMRVW